MLNVAVVGSGPAGLYAAEALVKQVAALPVPVPVRVDVIDRLPTPYGLVRYGVAPDHKSIKSIAQYLRKVLESPDVRFLGGVHLGEDVHRDDLVSAYDAVIYATGAMRDRRLGVPGEDLPGSYAATDFVNWYCGHPDIGADAFTLDAESVAVIGVGNVAVDVARILARDPHELHATDVPQPGVPFDSRASVVPNAQGRVLGEDGAPLPGEYVAGWLKRGPTGVFGTNQSDAAETVRCLLEDLAG